MARQSQEREDLLRDARALMPRILLRMELDGQRVDVLAGFRGEALSLYFGDDPVFHFNASGELRRAFVDDQLIKAEDGRLVALTPRRSEVRTEFVATALDRRVEQRLLKEIDARLRRLSASLIARRFEIAGQEPSECDALARLLRRLADSDELKIARSPRVGD
jgi:hypothetical protein